MEGLLSVYIGEIWKFTFPFRYALVEVLDAFGVFVELWFRNSADFYIGCYPYCEVPVS